MSAKLSITETIDFWGGFKLEKISDSPVQYADICTATLSQADYLPHNGLTGPSLHIWTPCGTKRDRVRQSK